jgi:transcription initiation factor TFIIIB Brf1 subunit/transcription initiation factor TFIIB
MGMYRGNCPECKSSETMKERINGNHTGDLICLGCKYIGTANEFKKTNPPETQKD